MSEKKEIVKEYTNNEVTIVWKPHMCMHSTKCINGLPQVFDVNKRPWATAGRASSEAIVSQIKKCPSGALSYYMNATGKPTTSTTSEALQIEVAKNGPLLMKGLLDQHVIKLTLKFFQGKKLLSLVIMARVKVLS